MHLALDFEDAERVYALERRNEDTPDRVFDRKWAAITLDRALQRLRVECQQAGKAAEADALLPYLTDTGQLPPYRAVAASLELTEGAVKVAVHRLRQRFGVMLRLEIGDTVLDTRRSRRRDARADSRCVRLRSAVAFPTSPERCQFPRALRRMPARRRARARV